MQMGQHDTPKHWYPTNTTLRNNLENLEFFFLAKPTVTRLVRKFPAFYGTWRFITVLTRARHWTRWNQSTPSHLIPLRSILILSSHLRLGLSSSLSSTGLSIKNCYAFLISGIHTACPAHIILTKFGKQYKLWRSSLCGLLQPSATSSFLGPILLLSTLFSNTLNLYSSVSVTDQVSHPWHAAYKLI
jgi:hypothetical protein